MSSRRAASGGTAPGTRLLLASSSTKVERELIRREMVSLFGQYPHLADGLLYPEKFARVSLGLTRADGALASVALPRVIDAGRRGRRVVQIAGLEGCGSKGSPGAS